MKKNNNTEINPLKELRMRLHKTQQEFATEIKVSKITISNVESGKHELSLGIQRDIAEKYKLYDDWYTGPNFKEKIDIDEKMKDILKHIMNNVDNERIARHILQNLKTIINTDGLSKEEIKIYAEYIYVIIRDLAMATTVAKKHIRNEEVIDITTKANLVKKDIMKLPGVNKLSKSLLDDYSF